MKKKNKINYVKPEVISYAHHAYPLGLIRTNKESEEWFVSNYIHMYYSLEGLPFNFIVEYLNNPFIEIRHIYKKEFENLSSKLGLFEWIKAEIDLGNAFEVIIDYYFLPPSQFYKKKHMMHEILIIGYDEQYCFYWDYVNGEYSENACKWKDIVPYESQELYGKGIAAKIIKCKNSTFVFDLKSVLIDLKNYFNSYNIYPQIAIWGDYSWYKECVFGISCIVKLMEYLQYNEYKFIDYRNINVFYEHKKCMTLRVEFLSKYVEGLSVERWMEIEKRWKILLEKCLKYNVYLQRGKTCIKKYEDIINEIEQLYTMEKKEMHILIAKIEAVVNL